MEPPDRRVEIQDKTQLLDAFMKVDEVTLRHELYSGEMSEPMIRLRAAASPKRARTSGLCVSRLRRSVTLCIGPLR